MPQPFAFLKCSRFIPCISQMLPLPKGSSGFLLNSNLEMGTPFSNCYLLSCGMLAASLRNAACTSAAAPLGEPCPLVLLLLLHLLLLHSAPGASRVVEALLEGCTTKAHYPLGFYPVRPQPPTARADRVRSVLVPLSPRGVVNRNRTVRRRSPKQRKARFMHCRVAFRSRALEPN